jgi:hypothetical protein
MSYLKYLFQNFLFSVYKIITAFDQISDEAADKLENSVKNEEMNSSMFEEIRNYTGALEVDVNNVNTSESQVFSLDDEQKPCFFSLPLNRSSRRSSKSEDVRTDSLQHQQQYHQQLRMFKPAFAPYLPMSPLAMSDRHYQQQMAVMSMPYCQSYTPPPSSQPPNTYSPSSMPRYEYYNQQRANFSSRLGFQQQKQQQQHQQFLQFQLMQQEMIQQQQFRHFQQQNEIEMARFNQTRPFDHSTQVLIRNQGNLYYPTSAYGINHLPSDSQVKGQNLPKFKK